MKQAKPKTLFHYTSAGGAIGVLKSKCAWASKIQHLNDEREYIEYIDVVRRVAAKNFKRSESDEAAFLDDFEGAMGDLKAANIFVGSFTESGDLLSQWRGYCPSGGYALGFSAVGLERAFAEAGLHFCKASYGSPDETEILVQLEGAFRDHRAVYNPYDPLIGRTKLQPLISHILKEAPKYKDSGFEEEQEWRVYSPLLEWDDSRIDVVDIRGRLRPILRVSLIAPSAAANDHAIEVTNVFVSPGPDADLRRESLVILLRRLGCAYKQVRKSIVPYNPR